MSHLPTNLNTTSMLTLYEKIWISTYLKIKDAQDCSDSTAKFLTLIVIIASNFLNVLFIAIVLLLVFKFRFNIPENRFLNIAITIFVLGLPNYIFFIYSDKHENLLTKFSNKDHRSLGLKYFLISSGLVLILVFSTIIFPHFFGLKS